MVCLALDGEIHETNDLFASHPNCRCSMVPLIDGIEYTPRESAQSWLASQPEAEQQKILGQYYPLYQSGTPLTDMVRITDDPTWGPTLRRAPLSDLVTGV